MAEAKKEAESKDHPVRYKLGDKIRTVTSTQDKIRLEFDGWRPVK